MSAIEFTKGEKEVVLEKIQSYFRDELESEIGQFEAEFLLDFFAREIGVYFYNRGLYDAEAILKRRLDDITEAIGELEKFTEFKK